MQNVTLFDRCVVDAGGLYRAFVTVQTEQSADGEPKETVLGYKLAEGESLLDAPPPIKRQPAVLEWHAQKQQCHTFTIEEYTALSLAIAAYVYPYRRYQEQVKAAIYAAQSKEELDAIEIDYGSVGAAA